MKKQLLLVAFTATLFSAKAQMDSFHNYRFDPDKGIEFFVGLGAGYNDYDRLNQSFKDVGLPTVGKFSLQSAMQLDFRNKNFLIGLGGNMGVSYKRPDNFNVFLLNFSEQLHLAYYVANSKNFHVAPQVGIGYMSSYVNLSQREGTNDFNEVLADGNALNINQGSGILDFCLRFDFADFTRFGSKAASIQAGYRLGLSKRGWGIDALSASSIDNSPKDRIGQVYLMLALGFAGNKPIRK